MYYHVLKYAQKIKIKKNNNTSQISAPWRFSLQCHSPWPPSQRQDVSSRLVKTNPGRCCPSPNNAAGQRLGRNASMYLKLWDQHGWKIEVELRTFWRLFGYVWPGIPTWPKMLVAIEFQICEKMIFNNGTTELRWWKIAIHQNWLDQYLPLTMTLQSCYPQRWTRPSIREFEKLNYRQVYGYIHQRRVVVVQKWSKHPQH